MDCNIRAKREDENNEHPVLLDTIGLDMNQYDTIYNKRSNLFLELQSHCKGANIKEGLVIRGVNVDSSDKIIEEFVKRQ